MEQSRLDKIYQAIYNMAIGDEFIIAEKVAPENREGFISEIKAYINYGYGYFYGWDLAFSNDFSKFMKIEYCCIEVKDIKDVEIV